MIPFLPSRPARDHRAVHIRARWLTEEGRLHQACGRLKKHPPYLLGGLQKGKTQHLMTLSGIRIGQGLREFDDLFPYLLRGPRKAKSEHKSWYQYIFFDGGFLAGPG
jgi:hypothetical protein